MFGPQPVEDQVTDPPADRHDDDPRECERRRTPAHLPDEREARNGEQVLHGVRAFVPYMLKARQEAWIANLASIGAFGVMPTQTAYIMSKHAVQAFSECLYLEMELVGAPIHVSSVIPGMLKTSIFDAEAGAGEPAAASAHRKVMHDLMKAHGMDLAEGCARIMAKIAAGEFWADTQPEMTRQSVDARIDFLRAQRAPALAPQARQLLGG